MAILSNINGKFAVDSTGAIQFSGSAGASGYVLKSTGSGTAPTWVDPSTVIGGPYLPLAGGTLTGATATASGISFTVGGTLTGTSATFSGDVTISGTTGSTGNALAVNRGSDGAQALRIQNSGEVVIPSNYLYCNAGGTSLYVQNTAVFRGSIINDGGDVTISDTLSVTGNATFAGNLNVNARGFFNSGGSYPLATSSTQRYNIQIRNTNNTVNSGYGWWWGTDTNFNMFFHADGASDKMTLTRLGELGVNFTSPGAYGQLTVSGTSALPILALRSGSGKVRQGFYEGGTGRFYLDSLNGSDGLAFIDGDGVSTRMLIDSDGKVGIGITSPGAQLHNYSTATQNVWLSGYGTLAQNDWGAGHGIFAAQDNGLLISKANASNNTNRLFVFYHDSGGNGEQYIYDTNSTVKVKLDSAGDSYFNGGNVGIGTTSPAARLDVRNAGQGGIELWPEGLAVAGTNLINNYDRTGDNFVDFEIRAAQYNWKIGTSSKMVMLSSGNVGIGTASPDALLELEKSASGAVGPTLLLNNNAGGGGDKGNIIFASYGTTYQRAKIEFKVSSETDSPGNIDFYTGRSDLGTLTQKMTILGSGNVGIGNTSPQTTLHTGPTTTITNAFTARFAASNFFASGGNSMFYVPDTAANIMMFGSNQLGTNQIEFYHKNPGTSQSYVGRISTSGSATSYVTSSDYRLKENIVPISNSISRLNQLKPSRFNFIEEPNKTVDGFIAHEVQNIVPEAIVGKKDAVNEDGSIIPQGIDQAKLVPLLVAAIQELEARVKELENK